jgi:hypothetical protein
MPPLSKSHDQTNFPFLDMQYNKARDQILHFIGVILQLRFIKYGAAIRRNA